MSITAIESVLQQMRATAVQAGFGPTSAGTGASAAGEAQGGGFADELRASLGRINSSQQQAYGKAEDFELGKPGVALNDVMVDLQKANVAFQTGLQVRNRLVAAYQEVMSLPA
jgi:flagellar hook-basal body complex protein FliE